MLNWRSRLHRHHSLSRNVRPSERTEWLIETVLRPLHQIGLSLKSAVDGDQSLIMQTPPANFMAILIGASIVFFVNAFQIENQYGVNPMDPAQIEAHADIVVHMLFPKPLEESSDLTRP